MNKVTLIGRLTKDPELRYTPGNGTAVTTLTLAVDRRTNKDGQREADFIPVVIWGKQAESTAQYITKGKLLGVAGRIQVRNYEAKDGTRRYVTEVVAEEVQFLEWGDSPRGGTSAPRSNKGDFGGDFGPGFDDLSPVDEGDIPF
ncbi:Single-stranded DNA-binding protein [Clostridiaceae bacterium JG1575]|nr:Single-stranded DNA-binding protein [Clostridiaceae bacterium JG1575]